VDRVPSDAIATGAAEPATGAVAIGVAEPPTEGVAGDVGEPAGGEELVEIGAVAAPLAVDGVLGEGGALSDEAGVVSDTCCTNGSLLAKRSNETSWERLRRGGTSDSARTVRLEPTAAGVGAAVVIAAVGVVVPAVGVVVAAAPVVIVVGSVEDAEDPPPPRSRGTWIASTVTSTTPPTIAIFFCRRSLATRAVSSASFLLMMCSPE
jgi:hypothetical protein